MRVATAAASQDAMEIEGVKLENDVPASPSVATVTADAVASAFLAIQTRSERDARRHQRKQKPGCYYIGRPRKRKHQHQCKPVRSAHDVYHTTTIQALFARAFLHLPDVARLLQELRLRRPVFREVVDSDSSDLGVDQLLPRVKSWPKEVHYVAQCRNPQSVVFPDGGDMDKCVCQGDCFLDTCYNAAASIYCTEENCILGGRCSNAPRIRSTLRLCKTRTGLGVFSTSTLEIGDLVGEYCGVLCPYDGIADARAVNKLKYNSGYTMLLNQRSVDLKFVYIEPKRYGAITRFINHACHPNATFVEMRNRRNVKVFVRMLKTIEPGTEITVSYGNALWF